MPSAPGRCTDAPHLRRRYSTCSTGCAFAGRSGRRFCTPNSDRSSPRIGAPPGHQLHHQYGEKRRGCPLVTPRQSRRKLPSRFLRNQFQPQIQRICIKSLLCDSRIHHNPEKSSADKTVKSPLRATDRESLLIHRVEKNLHQVGHFTSLVIL